MSGRQMRLNAITCAFTYKFIRTLYNNDLKLDALNATCFALL